MHSAFGSEDEGSPSKRISMLVAYCPSMRYDVMYQEFEDVVVL